MASLKRLVKALENKKATPVDQETAKDAANESNQRANMGAGLAFGGCAEAKRLKKGS